VTTNPKIVFKQQVNYRRAEQVQYLDVLLHASLKDCNDTQRQV